MISRTALGFFLLLIAIAAVAISDAALSPSELLDVESYHRWTERPGVTISSDLLLLAERVNHSRLTQVAEDVKHALDADNSTVHQIGHYIESNGNLQIPTRSEQTELDHAIGPILLGPRKKQRESEGSGRVGPDPKTEALLKTLKNIELVKNSGREGDVLDSNSLRLYNNFARKFRMAYEDRSVAIYFNKAKNRWEACALLDGASVPKLANVAYCGDVKTILGESAIPKRRPIWGWDAGFAEERNTQDTVVEMKDEPVRSFVSISLFRCDKFEKKVKYDADPELAACLKTTCRAICCSSYHKYSSFCRSWHVCY